MTKFHPSDRDVNRVIRSWLREDQQEDVSRIAGVVLDQLDATPQRRTTWWPARRTPEMNKILAVGLGAAAVIAVLLIGSNLLGSGSPPPGGEVPDSTPTPVTLASGSFRAPLGSWAEAFDIEATGTGDDVSGTMEVSSAEGTWAVDLQCSRTNDEGLLVIGGEVTASTHPITSEGAYSAILLAPGTPVRTLLWLDDVSSPADSCPAFLGTMFSAPEFLELTGDDLVPIEGDLELGP